MSSACDLRALAPADGGGPVKFPIGPYVSAASYFDAYAEELSRAVGLGITHCSGLDEWGIIGGGEGSPVPASRRG